MFRFSPSLFKVAAEAVIAGPESPVTKQDYTQEKSRSMRDIMTDMYGAEKATEYIDKAKAYQKQHPEVDFGYDPGKVDTKFNFYKGENDPKYVGQYNSTTKNITVTPNGNYPSAAGHEIMHGMSLGGFPFYSRSAISGNTSDMLKNMTSDANVKEIPTTLWEIKQQARQVGHELDSPEAVEKYFDLMRNGLQKNRDLYKEIHEQIDALDIQRKDFTKKMQSAMSERDKVLDQINSRDFNLTDSLTRLLGAKDPLQEQSDELLKQYKDNRDAADAIRIQYPKLYDRLEKETIQVPYPVNPPYMQDKDDKQWSPEVERFVKPLLPGYTMNRGVPGIGAGKKLPT